MATDDPRVTALEALFVIADLGTGRHRLTVPEIASGGWGGPDDGPTGTRERVAMVKAALVGAILRRLDEAVERIMVPSIDQPDPTMVVMTTHERAALVRERDEARAEAANLRKAVALLQDAPGKVERLTERVALLEATLADYEREARARSPEGRRAAQLALFAPPAADPAGEAQRAAASGAAVGALVGAAADAPATEAKPRRTVTCSTCSETGHNARGCPKRYAVGGES